MHDWDAVETAARVADGEVSAEEVTRAALERAAAAQDLAAVTHLHAEAALAAARAVDAGERTGALAGVPTAIKDLDDVAGVPTSFGSRAFPGYVPSVTSPAVAHLLATGMVSIGKSSTPEWGLTATTEPLGRPPTRNPWDRGRSVGGSSGGAAALVAAGVVPIAHATDGGGSIRIPAAACGLVGLKPSRGRLTPMPRSAQMPISLTVWGVLARTVRDVATFHAAAERLRPAVGMPPIGAVHGPSSRRLRVAVVRATATGRPLDPEVADAVTSVAATLDDLGHRVVEIPTPFDPQVAEDFILYWAAMGFAIHRFVGRQVAGDDFRPDLLEPWTRGLSDLFRRNPLRGARAVLRLRGFGARYAEAIAPHDVLLTPTTATPPPPIGHLAVDLPFSVHRERVESYVPFTAAQNLAGAPAISLPLARTREGLPIGLHLGAARGDDRTLLELAHELEQARPWPRLPPVAARAA